MHATRHTERDRSPPVLAIVLKGYPRLSETFIAQEIHALEQRGHELLLVSLRHPTDRRRHPVHGEIRALVSYLPEYLYREPLRVWRAWRRARRLPGYRRCRAQWLRDLRRDPTPNRVRRFGQALVLAAELPASVKWLYAHFVHTPASVARYASLVTGLPWSCSAHAKDVWTTPHWELAEKLAECRWLVTCTRANRDFLSTLSDPPERVQLLYHGLDFARFDDPGVRDSARDGRSPGAPVRLLSVGRAVPKKGYDDLLHALARLPADCHWRFTHVGGGEQSKSLAALATRLGLERRIEWLGALPQAEVLARYRDADLFVLPSRVTADGDRDGLPNVLMEAQSQRLACLSTRVSGIPELIDEGVTGELVGERDPAALAEAMAQLIGQPELRRRLADAGFTRVRERFSHADGIARLSGLLPAPEIAAQPRTPAPAPV